MARTSSTYDPQVFPTNPPWIAKKEYQGAETIRPRKPPKRKKHEPRRFSLS